jgi:uncharacterized protein YjiS (DUF1127 family)
MLVHREIRCGGGRYLAADRAGPARPSSLIAALLGPLRLVRLWRRRACERALLATLPDRELRDIGISRTDAAQEYEKPFWRP